MRYVLIPACVAAALGVALLVWAQTRTETFFVSGFIEADEIRVGSRVGGRVQAVHVDEGDRVEPGALLIGLEPYDLQARLAEAEAQRAAQQAVLDRLEAGFRSEEIAQARAARDRLRAVLDLRIAGPRKLEIDILAAQLERAGAVRQNAQNEYNRVQSLFESGQAGRDEFDRMTTALTEARASEDAARDALALAHEGTRAEEIAEARAMLAEAEALLALRESGARPEEIAEARSALEAAKAAVAVIRAQIEELSIRAPQIAATAQSVPTTQSAPADRLLVEVIDLQPGDLAPPHAPLLTLVDIGRLWIRAYLPTDRLNVQIGQNVWVRVDAYPDRYFRGRISFVARTAEFMPANVQTPEERVKQVHRIQVDLLEGLDQLRPGMPADVFFEGPR